MKAYKFVASRMVAGKPEPVPETEYAKSLVEVIRKVRILCCPNNDSDKEEVLKTRLSMLSERLDDLEGIDFAAKEIIQPTPRIF